MHMTDNTMAWQIQGHSNDYGNCYSGAMTTAGNLAFTAFLGRNDMTAAQLLAQGIAPGGTFVASDATTGKILWKWGTPGVTFGGPAITYSYKGKQYIAIYHGSRATTLAGGVGSTRRPARSVVCVLALSSTNSPRQLRGGLTAPSHCFWARPTSGRRSVL